MSCQLPDKTFKTVSKNISITGIAFETSETIDLHDLMHVRLHDDHTGNHIDAKIRIVRKEATEDDKFHIGAEFIELGANCKELLHGMSKRKELVKK